MSRDSEDPIVASLDDVCIEVQRAIDTANLRDEPEVAQALAVARLGNDVSYSFRSPVLANVTPENADAIVAAQQAKAIKIYPATGLIEIRPHSVVLETVKTAEVAPKTHPFSQKPIEIENDFIFAMIGAELPTAFLRAIGIKMVNKGRVYG